MLRFASSSRAPGRDRARLSWRLPMPEFPVELPGLRPAGLASATLAAMLAACSVGPDYERPEPVVPARFTGDAEAADGSAAPLATASDPAFWRGFGDSRLS